MSDRLFAVDDQVVLVSGASRGIGHAIARGFAERGAQVIVTGHTIRVDGGTTAGYNWPIDRG